jgi:hypothetical protein
MRSVALFLCLAIGATACASKSHFGPRPFELEENEAGELAGGAFRIRVVDGCIDYDPAAIVHRELDIAGKPAVVEEYPLDFGLTTYWYVVDLRPGVDCTIGGRFLIADTGPSAPGDYAENKRVLDVVMAAMRLDVSR